MSPKPERQGPRQAQTDNSTEINNGGRGQATTIYTKQDKTYKHIRYRQREPTTNRTMPFEKGRSQSRECCTQDYKTY